MHEEKKLNFMRGIRYSLLTLPAAPPSHYRQNVRLGAKIQQRFVRVANTGSGPLADLGIKFRMQQFSGDMR